MAKTTCWSWTIAFKDMTGHDPFPWQKRLFTFFVQGEVPSSVNIPTGLGKTAVIVLWLLALVEQRVRPKDVKCRLPRRHVYVVNRRTIVDQSTRLVEQIRESILAGKGGDGPLRVVYDALADMASAIDGRSNEAPLAVGTLRGEWADNREWQQDPARAAIVIGTVDMIGSKLLFSGYGDSRYFRPLHAGLLGCDTLLVHDEAHLSPAFGRLIRRIRDVESLSSKNPLPNTPRFQVMELSATLRQNGDADDAAPAFQLEDEDRDHGVVRARLDARKKMHLHLVNKAAEVKGKLVELALEHAEAASKVVVFVQSPEDAAKITEGIIKELSKRRPKSEEARVALLTGEIRGYERDALLKTPAMRPFIDRAFVEETVYLVSTSAGEVGMDLHADHLVGDLQSLDSMIQRLGRANRFGQTEARIDIVYEAALLDQKTPSNAHDLARWHTMHFFRSLRTSGGEPVDVSPSAIREWSCPAEAFSCVPEMAELTDILLDFWSQTSIEEDIPGRPQPATWLHGRQDELPETYVAWREEVSLLTTRRPDSHTYVLSDDGVARWFRAFPIISRERLRIPTHRLALDKDWKSWVDDNRDRSLIVLLPNGQARTIPLEQLEQARVDGLLGYATIVLPIEAGGLTEYGVLNPTAKGDCIAPSDLDVALPQEGATSAGTRVCLIRSGEGYFFGDMHAVRCTPWSPEQHAESEDEGVAKQVLTPWTKLSDAIKHIEKENPGKRAVFYLQYKRSTEDAQPEEIDDRYLLLLREKARKAAANDDATPTLDEHQADAERIVAVIVARLELPAPIAEALCVAARWHDVGKANPIWQRAAGHMNGDRPKAKSTSGVLQWRMLDGYRHELGSMAAAEARAEIENHPERDLILHLIAAHHGWSRPHFEAKAFVALMGDTSFDLHASAREAMLRFARLQERFGWWRLAWLESLLRRADGLASGLVYDTTREET